ncbi:MAG TPA: choice-of-anchor tandem repeat GloVer-containing protein, partial [Candidatus Bathyarchaeia archaeon]|nr:choice-of-anchor tandem repeat GloVer-containing protein [Candidatus Bathyarchaeia archaeon]
MKSRTLMLIALVLLVVLATAAHAQYSVLYNFGTKGGDPNQPISSGTLAQGQDGNLYSTSPSGGTNNQGTVFRIAPNGTLTMLHSFDCCFVPRGGLTLGTDGNFYGTTQGGGTSDDGTIFKATPSGIVTVLYSFTGSGDGYTPYAPPVQGTDGNFYGTTSRGGNDTACGNGCGTVYKITPSGHLTTIYRFDLTHGFQPHSLMVQGTDGNFYGTTALGGTSGGEGAGVVFRITPTGTLTVLHNFCSQPGCADGQSPTSPLVQGGDGNLYGTAEGGGGNGDGVIYKITPIGKFTVLHNLNRTTDGYNPFAGNAGLVQATDGNFYGANSFGGSHGFGTFFKITSTGIFSVLHNFDGSTGLNPYVTPFQHTNGLIYGDTQLGGTGDVSPCVAGTGNASCGVFYRWNAGLKAFVSLLFYAGKVGNSIEFLGQGFTSTSAVSFNGTAAARTVVSGTYLTATVPNGATTGFVTVTTSGGTLKSNKIFRVIPQITTFSPTSGLPGASVVITGESFTGATSVTFGGVKGTITSVSYTKITATVPTGAKTGKITVTTPG